MSLYSQATTTIDGALDSRSKFAADKASSFSFPATYSFPPFFTAQPNLPTRQSQLAKWSSLIQAYCAHYRIFKQTISAALSSSLCHNAALNKRLPEPFLVEILAYMTTEAGGKRAEWIGKDKTEYWVWWKRPEEWASLLENWVEGTGQKGQILTLYELIEGEDTKSEFFHGMDMEVLQRSLTVLVKRGKAQVFGTEGQEGVKFF
ncbi:MAG: hypothetical protein Q9227_007014 [Pyrenula ochraceoflavens]